MSSLQANQRAGRSLQSPTPGISSRQKAALLVEDSSQPKSFLRDGKSLVRGTFVPVPLLLRPLGSPFLHETTTYELTQGACVVNATDKEGHEIRLSEGSTLVDGVLTLDSTGKLNAQPVQFLGKVVEEVEITDSEGLPTKGYIVRISQIELNDQDALRDFVRSNGTPEH